MALNTNVGAFVDETKCASHPGFHAAVKRFSTNKTGIGSKRAKLDLIAIVMECIQQVPKRWVTFAPLLLIIFVHGSGDTGNRKDDMRAFQVFVPSWAFDEIFADCKHLFFRAQASL